MNLILKYIFKILFKTQTPCLLETTDTAYEAVDRAGCQVHCSSQSLSDKTLTTVKPSLWVCCDGFSLWYSGVELLVSCLECLRYKILGGKHSRSVANPAGRRADFRQLFPFALIDSFPLPFSSRKRFSFEGDLDESFQHLFQYFVSFCLGWFQTLRLKWSSYLGLLLRLQMHATALGSSYFLDRRRGTGEITVRGPEFEPQQPCKNTGCSDICL